MNNLKRFLLLLTLLTSITYAQETSVSGTVKDNTDMPLLGVNVIVKNTAKGTSTDFDGNFTLNNVSVNSILEFSYVGYQTQEVTITQNNQVLNIILVESAESLDEVVVIGYGSQKKKEVTGAVSLVSSKTIEELRPLEASQALQGTTSGVTVNSASGSPGTNYNIVIRGISSNGNNQPLFIIDGYQGDLNTINPNDIESITVLKDAQAAIYGIKGANGVVLVTTKAGRKNSKPKINYDVYTGIQQTTKKLSYLNATEYALLLNESYAANGQEILYTDVSNLGNGTDWQDELFRNAFMVNHNLSLTGGGEKYTYYLGASDLTQDGIIAPDKSNFKRNTAKIKLGIDLGNHFKVKTSANYTALRRRTIAENGLGSVLFNALNYAPTFATNQQDETGFLGNEVINPLAQIQNTFNNYVGNGLEGNFELEYNSKSGFTATSRIGYKSYNDKGKNFSPIVNYGPGKVFNVDRNSVTQYRNNYNSYTWDTFLTYKKTFGDKHNTSFTLGNTVQKDWGDGLSATGYDIPNNSWEYADISLATGIVESKPTSSFAYNNGRLISYFGRVQYDYNGKYLFSAMLRRDASSDFNKNNRVDYFPSITAGWLISEESFFENVKPISFLKLRASYGELGNNVGRDLYRAILSGEGTYVLDGTLVNGTAVGALPNPEAKWETAKKFDVGLDINFLNDRLKIVSDYFIDDRNDLLISAFPVSGILGTNAPGSGNPTVNAGSTRNKGFETMISYNDNFSDNFNFGIAYNFSVINGEVTKINGGVIPEGGAFGVGLLAPARMEVGKPIGYFYGLVTDGIFQNQAEVDAHPSQAALGAEASPGDFRYKDINGDGVINFEDRTNIGNPQAKYYMGLNLNFEYKNFDFRTYMYAELDKEMIRNYERDQPNVNRLDYYLNRWRGEGTSNSVPRATTGATTNKLFSNFYVEDASFLRIQNIQLGYTLPAKFLEKIKMNKLRVYTTINNPFTFTKYKGFDPAATSGEAIGGGIDYGFYPVASQFILGLNVAF